MTRCCFYGVGFCMFVGTVLASGCASSARTDARVVQAAVAATAPATAPAPLASKIFNYADLTARASDIGEHRGIFRSPTATLDELEIHMTTLKAGLEPHAPHRHPYEEMVVLKEGTLEVTIEGKTSRMTGDSVMFFAPNDLHGWKNVGTTPAVYWVITWKTPKTAAVR